MTKLSAPLKWHGGKHYQADFIISHMPPRCKNPNAPAADDLGWLHYVEPYFGGGAVLLAQDPEGISEVANDMNSELTNFWWILASEHDFGDMKRILECTQFSKKEWDAARKNTGNGLGSAAQRAAGFFVFCRQSMSGRMKNFAPLTRNRTRRGMNEQASAWLNAIEGLPAVHERLKRVVILNDDALKVIKQQDGPRTLFYLDPPYLHETRVTTSEYGDNEMSAEEHQMLLRCLSGIKGRFMLSGYRSELYDDWATQYQWNRRELEIDNKSSSKKEKEIRTECLWTNF